VASTPEPNVQPVDQPGPPDRQRELRIRAAWIYHVEGRTQNEVAQALGLNRVAVTRLLSEARRRGEVSVRVDAALGGIVALERKLERRYRLDRVLVAPWRNAEEAPTRVISSLAGPFVSRLIRDNTTVGVGWGRTLHAMLPYLEGRPMDDLRVVSMLGGISEAKRFNPAEFAWQFAERFEAEGFLVPAPALVDSPQTKHALLERCGLDQVFQMAETSDVALLSCGGIDTLTTSFRMGHVNEAERQSLVAAGAVGDILYNFVDAEGRVVDHSINTRAISMPLDRFQRVATRVLISGGVEKRAIMRAALRCLRPSILITDELTAEWLADT
jgi:DNA-binding transcriptional regulator LsrR (DeoR family)